MAGVHDEQVPYEGIKPEWVEEMRQAYASTNQSSTGFLNYIFGVLLTEDLQVSSRPMLPDTVDEMHEKRLEGRCILQIVDIVNIGATHEHRTENTRGPTRTLKMSLTDGYQLVYGFEYQWMQDFSVDTPRGAKVVVQDVDVRHGLLLLTPHNCNLLGHSGNESLEQPVKSRRQNKRNGVNNDVDAYSSALRSRDAIMEHKGTPEKPPEPSKVVAPAPVKRKTVSTPPRTAADLITRSSKPQAPVTQAPAKDRPKDPYVDLLSSDENTSLKTNSAVHHHSNGQTSQDPKSRKRSRPSSSVFTHEPFIYFQTSLPNMSVSSMAPNQVVHIRALLQSVTNFQFDTGEYNLQVQIEDCTSLQPALVEPAYVGDLMGVTCPEFLRTMQQNQTLAYRWIARMQSKLMNLEGVMTLKWGETGWTLLSCREMSHADATSLLERVKRYK